jgi:hypothetical protein
VCDGFSERKIHVLTPMTAMPTGDITLLGHRCGYLLRFMASSENSWPMVPSMAARCVINLLEAASWTPFLLGLAQMLLVASFDYLCSLLFLFDT